MKELLAREKKLTELETAAAIKADMEAKHALEMSAAQQRHDELLSVMAEERREAKEQQQLLLTKLFSQQDDYKSVMKEFLASPKIRPDVVAAPTPIPAPIPAPYLAPAPTTPFLDPAREALILREDALKRREEELLLRKEEEALDKREKELPSAPL